MRPPICLLCCAGVLLAACKRDLELPQPTTAPRITSFSPSAAFAGEWLTISGSGFDPDPQANLVQFARASAQAGGVGAGQLVVRVPADAGDGRITVTTKGGISAPTETAFGYLGLGELRSRAVASEQAMLHKPYRLVATRDDTYLHSDLLLGVVRYGDPEFVAPEAKVMDATPSGVNGGVVWLESSGSGSTLVVDAGAYGKVTRTIDAAGTGPVVTVHAGGGLPEAAAVLRVDPDNASSWTVALHRLTDLAPVASWPNAAQEGIPQPLSGVAAIRNCADVGGGDLACLARQSASGPLRLARIRLTPPLGITWLPETATPVAENRFLPADPLCGDLVNRRAVIALADGTVVTAQMDVASPYFYEPAPTGSRTLVRSIACCEDVNGGTYTFVAKPNDDLLIRMQPFTGVGADWTAEIPKASQAAVWRNTSNCLDGVVHAAGEADNRVFVLGLSDGKVLARRSFDVLPGRVHAPRALLDRTGMDGAGWFQAAGAPPHLAIATAAPRGVIEWPLTAQRGTGLFPHFRRTPDGIGAVPWIDALGYVALGEQAFDAGDWYAPFAGAAQLAVDGPTNVYFATTAGLETVEWADGTQHVSPLSDAEFTSLGLVAEDGVPDAHVVAAARSGGEWRVRLWSQDEAMAGSPGRSWPSPGSGAAMIAAAAVLDGRLWAFYWDAESASTLHAVGLDSSLAATSDTPLDDVFYSILAVSPNSRTFVSWDLQPFSTDTSVVVWSGDPASGFARLATIPVQGQVTAAAFDGTGERLYVLTRGPDRIVVLE